VKLHYLKRGTNFGDHINPIVFKEIFNQEIDYAKPYNCTHLGMGSILERSLIRNFKNKSFLSNLIKNKRKIMGRFFSYNKPIYTLGSGFIENPFNSMKNIKTFRKVSPIALRGKNTLKALEIITNQEYKNVAFGDAGIFVNELLNKDIEKKHKIGVIPHMAEKNLDIVKQLAANPDIKIIDIENDYLQVIEDVASCETVISSSLHGLVTSNSLNVPNLWVKISDLLIGDSFKFQDYYSAFNKTTEVLDIRDFDLSKITPEFIEEKNLLSKEDIATYKTNLKQALEKHFSEFNKK